MKLAKAVVGAWVAVCANAFGGISIDCKYPGGNVKVDGIDEEKGVVNIRPDLRDTKGNWFHWDFTLSGAAGRTLHFQFPQNRFDYLASLRTDSTTLPPLAPRSAVMEGRRGVG